MATKKVGGGSKNGRNSIGRRLGIKVNNMQSVNSGQIIIRQRGMKYKCSNNTYAGKDHTIHSLILGVVKFFKLRGETYVSVLKNENN